ncbi:MAG: glycosyltransferase family 4 protein [Lachnospiraceae bacterium]
MREQIILSFMDARYLEEKKRNVIFDFSEGFVLSGAVKLAIDIAVSAKERGYAVKLFSNINKKNSNFYTSMQHETELFDFNLSHYKEAVDSVLKRIRELLPCTIVINQLAQVYAAAYIAKKQYGDQVRIISLIHSDYERIYDENNAIIDTTDVFLCVSKEIRENFINQYGVNPEKVYLKQNAIRCEKGFYKSYTPQGQAIHLAYAARIEKAQKRADLLIPFIQLLENKKINYQLHIAGDGSFYPTIKQFVDTNQLSNKVHLYGMISFYEMNQFWKDKDIFINLSDYEGCAIAMLEAMSFGVVPIVTNTSGVNGVIQQGINGFVHDREDIRGIVTSIELLNQDRKNLAECGYQAKEYIEKQNGWEDYMDFIESLI